MEEEREKSVLVDPRVVCDIESRNRPILFGGTTVSPSIATYQFPGKGEIGIARVLTQVRPLHLNRIHRLKRKDYRNLIERLGGSLVRIGIELRCRSFDQILPCCREGREGRVSGM